MIITENQLDNWVRGNAEKAQGVIVELIYRLVATSSPKPKDRRFSLADSVGQPGPDGFLHTDVHYNPYIPEGKSYWEIGTGIKPQEKATKDYTELTQGTPSDERQESTFIFVTPISGRRGWPYTWKEEAQIKWLENHRKLNDWSDVRIIDCTKLIAWIGEFPTVEKWLLKIMGLPSQDFETPEQRWLDLKSIGEPPPLIPEIFTTCRDEACKKLKEVLDGDTNRLKIDTKYPDQMADFVSAYVESLVSDTKMEIFGRSLILSNLDAWKAIVTFKGRHILIADFLFNDADSAGIRLLERAKKAGHAVVYSGMPGGIPELNRVTIPNPNRSNIRDLLTKAGYSEERSRNLAQKSDGNLSVLLRCIQNLSLTPEWASGTESAEIIIAELLGGWDESYPADIESVEKLSKKAYGEWIGNIRAIASRPGTPLNHYGGKWRMAARFEGWYSLGTRVFDEHLDLIKEICINVLSERDPQFDLPPDERYMASIHNKVLKHSSLLRKGLVEALALMGSRPDAITSCTIGKSEAIANLIVREILSTKDWIQWASLNDLLPLLAEASPEEFLNAVESAMIANPCPFINIFKQETAGITGRNYLTGLLWALETLAWDPSYLTRVIVLLGEIGTIDPGGGWGNRAENSLSTILLPWMPQTCAPIPNRVTAIKTLLTEVPDIGWKTLLSLLPQSQSVSSGSRKPVWRKLIPENHKSGVTRGEYWEQVSIYSEIAINKAKEDFSKIVELLEKLAHLPPPRRTQLLDYLRSNEVADLPQDDKLVIWMKLMDIITEHRKYADADWALPQSEVDIIAKLADALTPDTPNYKHRRLFSERDFDLYSEKGNYQEQREELYSRRKIAISDVFLIGGLEAVLEFIKNIESQWHAGTAFGATATSETERMILPELINTIEDTVKRFIEGFIWGRFQKNEWQWFDSLETSDWEPKQKGMILSNLPFTPATWERVSKMLPEDESPYWSMTRVNPYDTEMGLDVAINSLLNHDRPYSAIKCITKLIHGKLPLNTQQAIRALQAALNTQENPLYADGHDVIEIIKVLQDNPDPISNNLTQIEWSYLRLLDGLSGARPILLEKQISEDPNLFCEIIQAVYVSKKEKMSKKDLTKQQKNIAENAYHLLRNWQILPGSKEDGTIDGQKLNHWFKEVKKTCIKTGHWEIAQIHIGKVLIHAPLDSDGFWINHAVAKVLNFKEAEDLRDGFTTELFNSRGVYFGSGAKEESKLANKYLKQANDADSQGYVRLATALRKLSRTYERDAERHSSRDPFDELY
ncbi:MAG: hypothetical protein IIA61_10615 [Candidatus Marinimicrobia bacterium]|nr:hypothetical protein [Candidatus Neomarinimicrobiota bacterium]